MATLSWNGNVRPALERAEEQGELCEHGVDAYMVTKITGRDFYVRCAVCNLETIIPIVDPAYNEAPWEAYEEEMQKLERAKPDPWSYSTSPRSSYAAGLQKLLDEQLPSRRICNCSSCRTVREVKSRGYEF